MARKEIIHKAGSIVDGMVANYVPSEVCDSYYQGFIEGATLADKTMIEKACKWLESNTNPVFYSGNGWTTEEFIDNFKKAMEEDV